MPRKIRQIRINGNVAYVPLTKGYEAIIDADDASLVAGWNWCALISRHTVYAVRGTILRGKKLQVSMHRFIMGNPDGLEVDHADGNGLNNRRVNLRAATSSQNKHNARIRVDNRSGFKGVSFSKRDKRWIAAIQCNGAQRHLGSFSSAEAAHDAYKAASASIHGEFGRFE